MWKSFITGAAAGSFAWLVLRRLEAGHLVRGWHRAENPEAAISVIGGELVAAYARSGVESRCCVAAGVAHVVTTRQTHDRIAAALSRSHRITAPPLVADQAAG